MVAGSLSTLLRSSMVRGERVHQCDLGIRTLDNLAPERASQLRRVARHLQATSCLTPFFASSAVAKAANNSYHCPVSSPQRCPFFYKSADLVGLMK